jgi:hypothetical protein
MMIQPAKIWISAERLAFEPAGIIPPLKRSSPDAAGSYGL